MAERSCTPALRADTWDIPPANDDRPALPLGCRWRMVIDAFKTVWPPAAVWFAQQKLLGCDLNECLDFVHKELVARQRALGEIA